MAPGPALHGVVRHAEQLARLTARAGVANVSGPADVVHVQFTDALWGTDIGRASSAFAHWAAGVDAPIVVTLHDLPGRDVDPARDRRRSRGYAQVVRRCDAVVVSAAHESALAARLGASAPQHIDLPFVTPAAPSACDPSEQPDLVVLGFVYPGKGHLAAIEAAGRCGPGREVVAAGAVSPGHGALADDLGARAAQLGVRFTVTGPLSDRELAVRVRSARVPLLPGSTASASASLVTWLAAGRRPLVAAGPYSLDLGRRFPGALHLYRDAADLDDLIVMAARDPSITHRRTALPWPDVGAAHVALYRLVAGHP